MNTVSCRIVCRCIAYLLVWTVLNTVSSAQTITPPPSYDAALLQPPSTSDLDPDTPITWVAPYSELLLPGISPPKTTLDLLTQHPGLDSDGDGMSDLVEELIGSDHNDAGDIDRLEVYNLTCAVAATGTYPQATNHTNITYPTFDSQYSNVAAHLGQGSVTPPMDRPGLSPSLETAFTPELLKLAAQLEYDPAQIYQWVYENIEFEDYAQSRKGATATYRTRRGNEWDQSSLLIALLRISGVPARYYHAGTYNYLPPYQQVDALKDAIWVQAWLPEQPGPTAILSPDRRWVDLVPWFKTVEVVHPGVDLFRDGSSGNPVANTAIVDNSTLGGDAAYLNIDDPAGSGYSGSAEDYTLNHTQQTSVEFLEKRIQEYLNTTAVYLGYSLKDVPRIEQIVSAPASELPRSVPQELLGILTGVGPSQLEQAFYDIQGKNTAPRLIQSSLDEPRAGRLLAFNKIKNGENILRLNGKLLGETNTAQYFLPRVVVALPQVAGRRLVLDAQADLSSAFDNAQPSNDIPSPTLSGQSLAFTGQGESVRTSYPGIKDFNERSFSFWIKHNNADESQYVLAYGRTGIGRSWRIQLRPTTASGKFSEIWIAGHRIGSRQHFTGAYLNDSGIGHSEWHHVVVMYAENLNMGLVTNLDNQSTDLRHVQVYIDGMGPIKPPNLGASDPEYAHTTDIQDSPTHTGSIPLIIGYGGNFQGNLKDLRVYDRILSSQEAVDLKDGNEPSGDPAVAHWPLNGDAQELIDENHGSLADWVTAQPRLLLDGYPIALPIAGHNNTLRFNANHGPGDLFWSDYFEVASKVAFFNDPYIALTDLKAGSIIHIGVDRLEVTRDDLDPLADELSELPSTMALSDDADEREAYFGRYAALMGKTWSLRGSQDIRRTEELLHVTPWHDIAGFNTTYVWTTPDDPSLFDRQLLKDELSVNGQLASTFGAHPAWSIDAVNTQRRLLKYAPTPEDPGAVAWIDINDISDQAFNQYFARLVGDSSSINEARIFEDWNNTNAVSTIQGFFEALEADAINASYDNVEVITKTSPTESLTSIKSRLSTIASGLDQDTRDDIAAEVEQGFTVTTTIAEITLPDGRSTSVRMVERDDRTSWFFGRLNGGGSVAITPSSNGTVASPTYSNSLTISSNISNSNSNSGGGNSLPVNFGLTGSTYEITNDFTLDTVFAGPSLTGVSVAAKTETTIDLPRMITPLLDPVDPVSGELLLDEPVDISLRAPGFEMAVQRHYRSGTVEDSLFGVGWSWSHGEHLTFAYPDEASVGDTAAPIAILFFNAQGRSTGIQINDTPPVGEDVYTPAAGSRFWFTRHEVSSGNALTDRLTEVDFDGYRVNYFEGVALEFDLEGRLRQRRDLNGNYLAYEYGFDDERITGIVDRLGRRMTIAYGGNRKIASITDPMGRTVSYLYDSGNLTQVTDLEQNVYRYAYHPDVPDNPRMSHNLARQTLPNGDYLDIFYYPNDRVSHHINRAGDRSNIQYSLLNRYAEVWNERGYYRKVMWNPRGDVIRVQAEDKTVEQSEFDDRHNMVRHVDGNGHVTAYEYDEFQNRTLERRWLEISEAEDSGPSLESIWYFWEFPPTVDSQDIRFTRLAHHRLSKAQDEVWYIDREQTTNYEPPSNVIEYASDPRYRGTDYAYDTTGNLVAIWQADQLRTLTGMFFVEDTKYIKVTRGHSGGNDPRVTIQPNDIPPHTMAQLRTVLHTEAPGTQLSYDQHGNLLWTLQRVWERGDNGSIVAPLSSVLNRYFYDDSGFNRLRTERGSRVGGENEDQANTNLADFNTDPFDADLDGDGQVGDDVQTTDYRYDQLNRLAAEIVRMGPPSGLGAGVNNNPLDRVTLYEHDPYDKPVSVTDASGGVTRLEYDKNRRLVKTIDPRGGTREIQYSESSFYVEPGDRIVQETDEAGYVTKYEYDPTGNRIATTDARGNTTQFKYDGLNRLIETIDPFGHSVRTRYDGVGNVLSVIQTQTYQPSDGTDTTHTAEVSTWIHYDRADRPIYQISGVEEDGHYRATKTIYDDAGNVTEVVRGSLPITVDPARLSDIVDNDASINYDTVTTEYDKLNRPVAAVRNFSAQPVRGQWNLTRYDSIGRVLRVVEPLDVEPLDTGTNVNENSANAGSRRSVYAFDAHGNVLEEQLEQKANGSDWSNSLSFKKTTHRYDQRNLRVQTTHHAVEEFWPAESVADLADDPASGLDQREIDQYFDYDGMGRPIAAWQYVRVALDDDQMGTVTRASRRLHGTRTSYDAAGNLSLAESYVGTSQAHDPATEADGWDPVLKEFPNATQVSFTQATYTPRHLVESQIDALGQSTRFEYDANGNAIRLVGPEGYITQTDYDALNRTVRVTDAIGNVSQMHYDQVGNVVAGVDPLGHTRRVTYNAFNQPVRVSDPLGNTSRLVYDEYGRVKESYDANDKVTRYFYNLRDDLIEVRTPISYGTGSVLAGISEISEQDFLSCVHTEYDVYGRPIEVTTGSRVYSDTTEPSLAASLADAQTTETTYNILDQVEQIDTPISNASGAGNKALTTRFDHDTLGNVIRRVEGHQITHTDQSSYLRSDTRYRYDELGRLQHETVVGPDNTGSALTGTEPVNRLSSRTHYHDRRPASAPGWHPDAVTAVVKIDPWGVAMRTEFDAIGQVVASVDNFADAYAANPADAYDEPAFDLPAHHAAGDATTYLYNRRSLLVKQTPPAGVTDAPMVYEYDGLGRRVRATHDDAVTVTFYDAASRVTAVVDPNGNETRTTYDRANRPSLTIRGFGTADESVTKQTFDPVGNLTAVIDHPNAQRYSVGLVEGPGVPVVQYAYDELNRAVLETDADDTSSNNTYCAKIYDHHGNLVKTLLRDGTWVQRNYDKTNRMQNVQFSIPLGDPNATQFFTTQTFEYDEAQGRIQRARDNNGIHTTNQTNYYTSVDKPMVINRADGSTNLTHGALNLTQVDRDYDFAGRVVEEFQISGEKTTNQINDYDIRVARRFLDTPGVTGVSRQETLSVRHFEELSAPSPDPILERHCLTSHDHRRGLYLKSQTTSGYRTLTATPPVNADFTEPLHEINTRDALARPTASTLGPGGSPSNGLDLSLTYDDRGRELTRSYGTGSDPSRFEQDLSASPSYGFDTKGNVKGIQQTRGTTLTSSIYGYDALDRFRSRTIPFLLQEGYGYDAADNRTNFGNSGFTLTFSLDGRHQLIEREIDEPSPTVNRYYAYNDRGNLIEVLSDDVNPSYGDRRFTYDWRNRLIQVDGYAEVVSGSPAWHPLAAYVYDAFDRLVVRFGPEPGAALQGDGQWMAEDTLLDAVHRYAHAPGLDRIVAQYDGVLGHGVALSTSNTWLWHSNRVYAYGPYIDEPVALLDEDAAMDNTALVASGRASVDQIPGVGIYYLQRDRRYDVVGILDDTGALQEQIDYLPFGKLTVRDGSGNGQYRASVFGALSRSRFNNLFAFTGRHWDDRAGLYHFRARAYRQDQGRFLQRDPLGFADGINRYAYAGNNPLGYVDPSGTVSRSVGVNTTLASGGGALYSSTALGQDIYSEFTGGSGTTQYFDVAMAEADRRLGGDLQALENRRYADNIRDIQVAQAESGLAWKLLNFDQVVTRSAATNVFGATPKQARAAGEFGGAVGDAVAVVSMFVNPGLGGTRFAAKRSVNAAVTTGYRGSRWGAASSFGRGFTAGYRAHRISSRGSSAVTLGSNGGRYLQPAMERLGAGLHGGFRSARRHLTGGPTPSRVASSGVSSHAVLQGRASTDAYFAAATRRARAHSDSVPTVRGQTAGYVDNAAPSNAVRRNSAGQAIGPYGRFISDPARVSAPTVSRSYIRQHVRAEVLRRARRDSQGRLLDANTDEVITGPYHMGHRAGDEWWRIRDRAQAEGWTRQQLNDYANNPDLYQIELPANNLSRRFEAPR